MLLTIILVLFGYFFIVGIIHAILVRYAKEKSYNLVLASVIPVALLVLVFGAIGFLGDYLTSEILWRFKKPETTADD
jgi:hypothetical protein